MDIERLAVNKVSDEMSRCPHLAPYLESNDRTPLTDGHIDLHSAAELHSNRTFVGRVPVQVKGRKMPLRGRFSRLFPIDRTSMEGYLRSSGVLYFVVAVDRPPSRRRTIYYALLNPFRIQSLLAAAAKGQKRIPVPLDELPRDAGEIESILAHALDTRREDPALGLDPVLLERIDSFTLQTSHAINLDAPLALRQLEGGFTMSLETAGGMSVPMEGDFFLVPSSYVGEPIDITVRSGEVAFERSIRRQVRDDEVELELSDGLRIRIDGRGSEVSVTVILGMQDNLAGRVKDLEFYRSSLNSGFTINDRAHFVAEENAVEPTRLGGQLESLRKLWELLDRLAIDVAAVRLSEITDSQFLQLERLYRLIVEGLEYVPEGEGKGGLARLGIGSSRIYLLQVKGASPNEWRLLDLFAPGLGHQILCAHSEEAGSDRIFQVTPYDLVEDDELPDILNLHLESLVAAYEGVPDYPEMRAMANEFLLKLLKGADCKPARSSEFLEAAMRLSGWLIARDGEVPRHLVNRWQIVARCRSLTSEDRKAVRELKRVRGNDEPDLTGQVETACAILLGEEEEVEFCLQQMSAEAQETFRSWPIWTLWESRHAQAEPAVDGRVAAAFERLFGDS